MQKASKNQQHSYLLFLNVYYNIPILRGEKMNEEMSLEEFINEMSKDFEVKEKTIHKVINDFKNKGIEEELFLRALTEYALYQRGIKFSSHRVKVEQRTIDFYAKENNEFFSKYKNLVSYYSDEEEISYNKNLEDDYSDGNRIL